MTPSKIVSLVLTVLIIALGTVLKFAGLFPSAWVPWIGIVGGVLGVINVQLFAPWLPEYLPPVVGKVVSRLVVTIIAIITVVSPMLSSIPNLPPQVQPWLAFVSALISAIGGAFLPHEQSSIAAGVAIDPALKPAPAPKLNLAPAFLPFAIAFMLVTQSGCGPLSAAICGPGRYLIPPNAAACVLGFLAAVKDVVPCAVSPSTAGCIDAVISAGIEITACEPTCSTAAVPTAPDAGVAAMVSTHKVERAALRANIIGSFRAQGTEVK